MKVLEKPSPKWKANTAVCRDMPSISAKGTIIGIVVAACPLPEGITKLIKLWIINIPTAAKALGKPLIRLLSSK